MQIILSPAKLMDFSAKTEMAAFTKPLFPGKTEKLVSACQQLSESDISSTMKINAKMARDVYEYFQTFNFRSTPKRAATLAYNGIAYKGLNAHDFSEDDFSFAQQHLNIISGLYGVLRPLDGIKPYRLEMKRKIVPAGYKNLYDYWNETVNRYISKKLKGDDKIIVNAASDEYSKVVNASGLPKGTRIVIMNFLQQQGNDFHQIMVHTKKARGLLSRYIIKNRLTSIEDVKGFNYEDYFFYPKLSTDTDWFFIR